MLKHMVTSYCSRTCPWCITRHCDMEGEFDPERVDELYRMLSSKHSSLGFTGGEPMLFPWLAEYIWIAHEHFRDLHIFTADPEILTCNTRFRHDLRDIVFSIHEFPLTPDIHVAHDTPVYASVLEQLCYWQLPRDLAERGFSGMTISEDFWGSTRWSHLQPIDTPDDFTIRIRRREDCLRDPVILPDLEYTEQFNPYIYEARHAQN